MEERRIIHPRFLDATSVADRAVREIRAFDPTLDILWNGRIGRWVVVQKLNKWMWVTEKLRGIATIDGPKTNYKTMFVCETDPPQSLPVTPAGPWIIRRICEVAPMSQEERLIANAERAQEEAEEAEFNRVLSDIQADKKTELTEYGGVGRYADPYGCDTRSKRHFVIASA